MLIKSAENASHFYHISSFSNQACSACLTQIACYNSHTYRDIWHATKNRRYSVLNLPKQRQVCPSLFFQFNNAHIRDLRHPKRVVSVLSPLASSSCGGSNLLTSSACSRGILQHALAIGFDHANILAMLQMQVFVCFHVVRLPVGCIKSSGAGVILRSHKFHNHLLYILPLPVLYLLTI